LTPAGQKRFTWLDLEALPALTDNAWCAWFAGFCDGEACFTIDKKAGATVSIALREDDSELLYEIQQKLGVGSVSFRSNQGYRDHPTRKNYCPGMQDAYVFRASSASAYRVAEAIRGYGLKSKKQRDFALWSEAIEKSRQLGPGISPKRKPLMLNYKNQIENVRKFSSSRSRHISATIDSTP
jgi:hypothetical protein